MISRSPMLQAFLFFLTLMIFYLLQDCVRISREWNLLQTGPEGKIVTENGLGGHVPS